MSQTQTGKATAADERTEAARSFVRTVKAATRRKYTPEEKIRIVLEGFRREATVSDLCRREGIKPHSYYSWTKEFMEAGKERLTRDSVRDATRQEVHQLKRENGELKQSPVLPYNERASGPPGSEARGTRPGFLTPLLIVGPPSGKFAIELVSEVSAPLSAAKWCDDRRNNT